MVRPPLSPAERERGMRLGEALRAARGHRTSVEVAARAGISVEALRKIEAGRVPTPAFFTVVAIAEAIGLSLDELHQLVSAKPASRNPVAVPTG